jgi:hypothetical protein
MLLLSLPLTINIRNDITSFFGVKIAFFPVFQSLVPNAFGFFILQRGRFMLLEKPKNEVGLLTIATCPAGFEYFLFSAY